MTRRHEGHGHRPGDAGGLCILDGGDVLLLADLPTFTSTVGKKRKRTVLDLHGLCELLSQHSPLNHCFIEEVSARPGQGVTSMFAFGRALGQAEGIVTALGIAMTPVLPQTWQRHHRCGAGPDEARRRATQLFPSVAPLLARVKDGNRGAALLIAAWGLATINTIDQRAA